MYILVFHTNLRDPFEVQQLKPALEPMPGLIRWSVDLDDCDRVLRVVSMHAVKPLRIQERIKAAGFLCEEMSD